MGDLQELSSSCWEGCTVLFHCFLDLSCILQHCLLLVLCLGGFIFVILCDLYVGHKMSVLNYYGQFILHQEASVFTFYFLIKVNVPNSDLL